LSGGANPWKAGLGGRCPRCGEGRLFAGFLRLEDSCDVCGLDLAALNAADGPAFFAMSFVGILVGFAALIVEVAYSPPVWAHLVIWLPLIVVLCVALLRPIKGVMVALQHRHRAAEVRNEDF
jgi:uncharacterized protein (DUF983 family)